MMTVTSRPRFRISPRTARPSMSGMTTSSKTIWTICWSNSANASRPHSASKTWYFKEFNRSRRTARMSASSSTTRIVPVKESVSMLQGDVKHFLDLSLQLFPFEWLQDKFIGAFGERSHCRFPRRRRSQDNHRKLLVGFADLLQNLDAGHLRHFYVEKHAVKSLYGEFFQSLQPGRGRGYCKTTGFQAILNDINNILFIIRQQDFQSHNHLTALPEIPSGVAGKRAL